MQAGNNSSTVRIHPAGLDYTVFVNRKTFAGEGRSSKTDHSSEADLLWYFAFGSNMDPDVLGRVRHVHPRQSQPCKVEGYVLTFAYRGLPYLEPGFGTIEKIESLKGSPVPPTLTLQTHTQHSGTAQAGKATMYSTPTKSVADQLSHKRTAQAVADRDPQSPQAASSEHSVYGSPELPVSFGLSRSSAKRSRSNSVSESSCDYEHSDFDLDGSHPVDSHTTGSTAGLSGHKHVEVHGVAHQISQQDMAQICKTEGGGGAAKHGYYVQHVPCQLYNGQTMQALTLLTHPSSLLHKVSTLHFRSYALLSTLESVVCCVCSASMPWPHECWTCIASSPQCKQQLVTSVNNVLADRTSFALSEVPQHLAERGDTQPAGQRVPSILAGAAALSCSHARAAHWQVSGEPSAWQATQVYDFESRS